MGNESRTKTKQEICSEKRDNEFQILGAENEKERVPGTVWCSEERRNYFGEETVEYLVLARVLKEGK